MTKDQALSLMWNGNGSWQGCKYWGGALDGIPYHEKSSEFKKYYANKDNPLYNGSDNYTICWVDVIGSNHSDKWCCVYVYWVFQQAFGEVKARQALYIDKWVAATGSKEWGDFACQDYYQNFRDRGGGIIPPTQVQPGDIFFTEGKNLNRMSHIGIINAVDLSRGIVYTAEGNHNDQCVFNNQRYIKDIAAFARPNWTGGNPPIVDGTDDPMSPTPQIITEQTIPVYEFSNLDRVKALVELRQSVQNLNR